MSKILLNSLNQKSQLRELGNCYVANCNYCASKDQCDQCKPGYEALNSKFSILLVLTNSLDDMSSL